MELVIKPIIFSEGYLVFQGLFPKIVGQHGLYQSQSLLLTHEYHYHSSSLWHQTQPLKRRSCGMINIP